MAQSFYIANICQKVNKCNKQTYFICRYKGKTEGKVGIIAAVYIEVESEPEKEERKETPLLFPKSQPSSQIVSSHSGDADDEDGPTGMVIKNCTDKNFSNPDCPRSPVPPAQ